MKSQDEKDGESPPGYGKEISPTEFDPIVSVNRWEREALSLLFPSSKIKKIWSPSVATNHTQPPKNAPLFSVAHICAKRNSESLFCNLAQPMESLLFFHKF